MTWTWLFAWNACWLILAHLYVSLDAKVGEDPLQGGLARNLERREVKPSRARPARVPRLHRRCKR
jgi:hypothetical protein